MDKGGNTGVAVQLEMRVIFFFLIWIYNFFNQQEKKKLLWNNLNGTKF